MKSDEVHMKSDEVLSRAHRAVRQTYETYASAVDAEAAVAVVLKDAAEAYLDALELDNSGAIEDAANDLKAYINAHAQSLEALNAAGVAYIETYQAYYAVQDRDAWRARWVVGHV